MHLFIAGAVGLQMITLALTYTRTGFLIGVVLLTLLLANRMLKLTPHRILAGVLLLVIGFAMLPNAYKERVFSPRQYTQSNSVESRLELQEAAARYAAENPVFGLGAGGFGLDFIRENYETAQVMKMLVHTQGWDPVFIGTHNMYLQLLADSGVPGFLFFVCFFMVMVRRLYRMQQQYRKEGDQTGDVLATSLFISLIGFALVAVFLHALHQEIWYMVAAAALVIPLHQLRFDTPPEAAVPLPGETPQP
jgi:O-antigen ligase